MNPKDIDAGYRIVPNSWLYITGEIICQIGHGDRPFTLPTNITSVNAHGRLVTPCLIDSHTHLVFAGSRANEFEQRLNGVPYTDIAKQGGGILATVKATREASENKTLAHPASVDSLPTSANQENHVSMAIFAGRRLAEMSDNTRGILAVELLSACQGIDFLAPLKTTTKLEQAKAELRGYVSFYDKDRYFVPDVKKANQLLKTANHHRLMPASLLPSISS